MTPCCSNHPPGCSLLGAVGWVAMFGVGLTFGWRYVFLVMLVSTELDWLIRVWKHQ